MAERAGAFIFRNFVYSVIPSASHDSKNAFEKDQPLPGLEVETPGASAQNPISIADLTSTIRELLETGIGEVWVAGEISNFRAPGSGHLYFTLKDATATLAAVMFQREARRAGFALTDGQAVLARGTITVYEARGQYQIQVVEIRSRGQGSLQQRFEELKRKLAAEGLFALERKRALPVFPQTIGVVTSLQGAVLQDMLNILKRRAPGLVIRVRGVRVQGLGAAQEIAEAVGAFSADGGIDLLVVARGGGSLEDLWAFNEEPVARALAASRVPTISAVGHETDFTIADFVADLRAPTPSAAAELLTRDWGRLARDGGQAARAAGSHRAADAGRAPAASCAAASSYALREPRRVVRQWAQRLDDLRETLRDAAKLALQRRGHTLSLLKARMAAHSPAREVARRSEHLAHLAARLRALGPQGTLDRGYALVLDEQGRPVTQAAKTAAGQALNVVLSKGALGVQVTGVRPDATLADALRPAEPKAAPVKKVRKKQTPS
ncbi:MAG: exodeoxyribonuclease VII large subunit [Verrucomicrobiota bacterium]